MWRISLHRECILTDVNTVTGVCNYPASIASQVWLSSPYSKYKEWHRHAGEDQNLQIDGHGIIVQATFFLCMKHQHTSGTKIGHETMPLPCCREGISPMKIAG